MSTGGQQQRSENLQTTSSDARPDASPDQGFNADMLRDIVAQTASHLAKPQEVDPAVKAAMFEVARRFAGQPMTVDPVGAALLEAVLRTKYAILASRPALLARTARAVAETLLTDPEARLRVEHLWAVLAEEIG
jgi:hypothetical protein